jgi:hypothetical protein
MPTILGLPILKSTRIFQRHQETHSIQAAVFISLLLRAVRIPNWKFFDDYKLVMVDHLITLTTLRVIRNSTVKSWIKDKD